MSPLIRNFGHSQQQSYSPVYPIHTWQRHLKLSINQNQHLHKFMRVFSSLYNEDVQFADCLNVHPPPPKKRRYFHALPLVALPPLANYLHINHNFFTSFKMYILFLFKAQTMNEQVLLVQVYAASNGCTHGQGHGENLSLSSTHVRIAPSL